MTNGMHAIRMYEIETYSMNLDSCRLKLRVCFICVLLRGGKIPDLSKWHQPNAIETCNDFSCS